MIYDDFYIESKNVRNRMKERRIIDNLGDAVYKVKEGYKYRRDGDSSGRYDRENKTYTISTDIDNNKKSIPIGRIKVSGSSAMPSKKIRDKINNINWEKESEEEWKKFKNESGCISIMTREEFESILEEAYIEGYNTAIEDIQEDILDEEAYDLEGEYGYYTEAWKPNEFIDYKAQREYTKSGKKFADLGKNKADFMRSRILPKLHAHLSKGGTFTKAIDDMNEEGRDASKYFKRGHAIDQLGDYARRVGKYLSYKASKKSK